MKVQGQVFFRLKKSTGSLDTSCLEKRRPEAGAFRWLFPHANLLPSLTLAQTAHPWYKDTDIHPYQHPEV